MGLEDLESLLLQAYCVIFCGLIQIQTMMDFKRYSSKQMKLEDALFFMELKLLEGS